jgi:probable addiction module antidote protein
MSKRSVRFAPRRPQPRPLQAAADCLNQALKKSDMVEICHAIGAAIHLYNISDLAQKSGLARPSLHRSFAGPIKPNFATILKVLDAMGLRLHVTVAGARARPARVIPVANARRLRPKT